MHLAAARSMLRNTASPTHAQEAMTITGSQYNNICIRSVLVNASMALALSAHTPRVQLSVYDVLVEVGVQN